jgi:hypothetical protein
LFNAGSGADVYYIQYNYDGNEPTWAGKIDAQDNTYVRLIKGVNLKEGENTLTIRIDSSISAVWHFREYFIVKSAS